MRWLGVTLPSNQADVVMESPEGGSAAQWEAEWRQVVVRMMGSGQD